MKHLSGLNDLLSYKNEFMFIIPNMEKLINIVKEEKYKNMDAFESLEKKLVSLCFAINMINDDYKEINDILLRQYNSSKEGIDKYNLQKLIHNYLSHIDSVLDYLDKFIKDLKKKDIKYERKFYDFDKVINNLRNEVLHEGIPIIHVTFSNNSYNENYSCCQWAGTIESEQNENCYLELEINKKRYNLQGLIDITYKPMSKKIKEIISSID